MTIGYFRLRAAEGVAARFGRARTLAESLPSRRTPRLRLLAAGQKQWRAEVPTDKRQGAQTVEGGGGPRHQSGRLPQLMGETRASLKRHERGWISLSRKDTHMGATTPRFGLGSTVWIIIVAVLLVVLATMVLYFK